jgi:hypothetical protein
MSLNNDDIKQLIAILQRGLTSDSTDDTITDSDDVSVKPKKRTNSTKKIKHKEITSKNKLDKMKEKNMQK